MNTNNHMVTLVEVVITTIQITLGRKEEEANQQGRGNFRGVNRVNYRGRERIFINSQFSKGNYGNIYGLITFPSFKIISSI